MTTSKQYDYLNRLGSIASTPSASFNYLYNAANQRTMNRLADGSYWRYGYDALGQVVSGNKFWVDQTPVAGQQFDYAFDTIGNRTLTEAGGDQIGANLRVASYTNNALNQITSRVVPGYVDIMGDGIATNAVTVNGQTAYRKVEYFRQQLAVNNSSAALWTNITVAEGGGSASGHLYVPQTPEAYTYDVDGNLLSDGRWTYAWDGENRLIGMTSLTNAPSGSQLQLVFTYDYQGRRIQKIVATNSGTAYVGEYTNNYANDGWNCLAMLNSAGLINSFMWGSDLSGSIQGAGGVGGLIEVALYGAAATNAISNTNGTQSDIVGTTNGSGAATVNCFAAFDGNGNVSALINAADGTTIANYEYDAFGRLIGMWGSMAAANVYRFSSKEYDSLTGLYYYGHRFYDPVLQRWLNHDPIGERGGVNLYGFAGNSPVNFYDPNGLYWQFFGFGFGDTATYMNANGTVGYGTPPSEQAPSNPNSYAAMRADLIGDPNDNNFNGQTGSQVVQSMVEQGVEQVGQLAMMAALPEGEFSIADWEGYPKNLPKPKGPCRVLTGKEYDDARQAANAANKALHAADDSLAGQQIHEIQPVKFGGDPTDPLNIIPLSPSDHQEVSSWWNSFLQYLKGVF